MLACVVTGALSLTTSSSYNNIFGNNNEIVTGSGKEITAPPPPSMSPSSLPLSNPSCPVGTPSISGTLFPPTDAPAWSDPFQKGLAGYSGSILEEDLLPAGVRRLKYAFPPGALSCLGHRGMMIKLAKDQNYADVNGTNTNEIFGLPDPTAYAAEFDAGTVDPTDASCATDPTTPLCQTYMTRYLDWKALTPGLANARIKRIRTLMARLIDSFTIILRAEQLVEHSQAGTRYWSDLLFSTTLEMTSLPDGIDKDLFPLAPTAMAALKGLHDEYTADPTGMSNWFSDASDIVNVNWVGVQGNINSHVFSAVTVPRLTGYSAEVITKMREFFTFDNIDFTEGAKSVQFFELPDYEVEVSQVDKRSIVPKNFWTCTSAVKLWEYMQTIKDSEGNSFVCTSGAPIIKAISDFLTYEAEVLSASDKSKCYQPVEYVSDLTYTMVYGIANSQKLTYGTFSYPLLTPEQMRVMMSYVSEILCIHVAFVNSALSCRNAGVTYYSRPLKLTQNMMVSSSYYSDNSRSTSTFTSQVLNITAAMSVSEVCAFETEMETFCGGPPSMDSCKPGYAPPDKKLGWGSIIPIPGFGFDRCKDSDNLFGAIFGNPASPAYNAVLGACAGYKAVVTPFDNELRGGCGFEMVYGGLTDFVNYDTKFEEICPESCNAVPSDCP